MIIQEELRNANDQIGYLQGDIINLKSKIEKMRNCYNCIEWSNCMQKNPAFRERCLQNNLDKWELKENEQ